MIVKVINIKSLESDYFQNVTLKKIRIGELKYVWDIMSNKTGEVVDYNVSDYIVLIYSVEFGWINA